MQYTHSLLIYLHQAEQRSTNCFGYCTLIVGSYNWWYLKLRVSCQLSVKAAVVFRVCFQNKMEVNVEWSAWAWMFCDYIMKLGMSIHCITCIGYIVRSKLRSNELLCQLPRWNLPSHFLLYSVLIFIRIAMSEIYILVVFKVKSCIYQVIITKFF